MTLDDIKFTFNRALFLNFSKLQLMLTFATLALCGVFIVFFRGLSFDTTPWLALSLTFTPIFICSGVLLSLGVLLIRIYHDQIKGREVNLKKLLASSWEVVIGASYFAVPILLSYLLLWMLLGVFVLLGNIPVVGLLFNTVLIFAPFLINLVAICLILLNIALLFYLAPILALKGFNRLQVSRTLVQRFDKDIFTNLLLLVVGLLPLLFVIAVLTAAAFLTGSLCSNCDTVLNTMLLWFFIMLPFTALLSPAVIFFFNFAAESHVLMHKPKA